MISQGSKGAYEARTGRLRFVERKVFEPAPQLGENISSGRLARILQQEYAVIENPGTATERRFFEWRDVPTEVEETKQ